MSKNVKPKRDLIETIKLMRMDIDKAKRLGRPLKRDESFVMNTDLEETNDSQQ